MSATLLPNAKQTFTGPGGTPLSGGSVYFYIPNTTTPKNTWQDGAQTILNTNPVVLDANGQAVIWGSGTYRQVVYDANNNLIWDQITEDLSGGLIGNFTDAIYNAGVDFTPGTTTTLTLPVGPGSATNTWVFFDAAYQTDSTYTINGTTLTFTSAIPVGVSVVTVKIGSTVSIGVPGAGTVTDATVANGAAIDSSKLSYLPGGAGAVRRTVQSKLRQWVDVIDYGADPTGATDCSTAIVDAISALGSNGGDVYFPPGSYLAASFPDLTNKSGIKIWGDGGVTAGATAPSSILVNATGPNPFINAPGSVSFGIEGIQFITKQPGFTGYIISLGSSPSNSAFGKVRRCGFYGSGSAKYIAKAISLDKTIEAEVESCAFGQLLYAIAGASNGSFSDPVKISGCQFIDTSQIPIQGGGQAWRVIGNTFEGYNNGTPGNVMAGAMVNFPTNPFNGLEFAGNWMGDVQTNGGTWLNLSGGGIDIHGGNFFGGNAGSDAIALASVDSANITGNTFDTFGVAISFGSGNGPNISVGPNEYISVTNRFGSTANWPGYAGPTFYEPLGNSKMQIRGTASVTAGTPQSINFPLNLAGAPESIRLTLAGAPGSVSALWPTSTTASGFMLNAGGSGTVSVYWEAIGPLPN